MNCQRFQNQLYEYVEGTLSAGNLAIAEQHLTGCDACRHVVRNEQQLAHSLSGLLRQKTESLALAPDIQRRILAAARRPSVSPKITDVLASLWNRLAIPAALTTAVVLIIALALVTHFANHRINEQPSEIVATQIPVVHLPRSSPYVSIHVSCPAPTYLFLSDGDRVIDTVSYETVVASETLPSFDQTPPKKKLL
jgi:anti-sigma factor RsiW